MGPITTGLGEIYQYTLDTKEGYENKYSASDLRTIQDWVIKRRLSGINGVVEINSWGGYLKQYEVAITPSQLVAMNVTLMEVFDSLKGDSCYITFGQTGSGLRTGGSGRLGGFSLAGRDSLFHNASASFVDGRVVLWSGDVPEPAAVRYAWADNPVGANLYNADGDSLGLPAAPFQWWRRSGDLDGNDRVDIFDLLGMLKMLGGSTAASGFADLDSNGKVDVFDLLQMLKRLSL